MELDEKLKKYISQLRPDACILDAGCGQLEQLIELKNIHPTMNMYGCDIQYPEKVPDGIIFKKCDFNSNVSISFEDNKFDFIICQHVLEHLRDPISAIQNLLSKLKPGGILYLETPSNYSTLFSYPFSQSRNLILNFYDDPTHIGRPWTPQAFYRISKYFSCIPLECSYEFSFISFIYIFPLFFYCLITKKSDLFIKHYWKGTGWVCFAFLKKPENLEGKPEFNYFSFKGKCVITDTC